MVIDDVPRQQDPRQQVRLRGEPAFLTDHGGGGADDDGGVLQQEDPRREHLSTADDDDHHWRDNGRVYRDKRFSATSILCFVATSILCFVATSILCFVVTSILLSRQKTCSVATKICLLRQIVVVADVLSR